MNMLIRKVREIYTLMDKVKEYQPEEGMSRTKKMAMVALYNACEFFINAFDGEV